MPIPKHPFEPHTEGPLRRVSWSRNGDALVMSYEIAFDGIVDILGVRFDIPESDVTAKRWLGKGPYRVWQNRLEGGPAKAGH